MLKSTSPDPRVSAFLSAFFLTLRASFFFLSSPVTAVRSLVLPENSLCVVPVSPSQSSSPETAGSVGTNVVDLFALRAALAFVVQEVGVFVPL